MKSNCCIDTNGAKHLNYDLLVKIGFSCFSDELIKQNIYYMPEIKNLEL